MRAEIEIKMDDGEVRTYRWWLTPGEADSLRDAPGTNSRAETELALFKRIVEVDSLKSRGATEFFLRSIELTPSAPDRPAEPPPAPTGKVKRCGSLLSMATAVLPAATREETLDEWMDEIECAADENLPVLRRAISILFRSLPVLAWRSRLPSRVRRPGSQ